MRKENRSNSPPTYVEALEKLSPREVEIVKRVKEGETSNEIAKNWVYPLAPFTHRHNICTKLKLEGKNALLKWVLWAMKDE